MSQDALARLRAIHLRGPIVAECAHAAAGLTGFNRTLAVWVTSRVGSVWTAYLFCLLALISLPAVLTQGGFVPAHFFPSLLVNVGLIALVAWVAQTFFQLVLLPVILVGQNVQQAAADVRAETDHEILQHETEILGSLHEMQVRQTELLEAVHGRLFPTQTTSGGAVNVPPAGLSGM